MESGSNWTQVFLPFGKKTTFYYCVCVGTVCILTFLFCFLEQFTLKPFSFFSVYEKKTETQRNVTILLWVHPFAIYGKLPDCFEQFKISGCRITDDKGEYQKADGVLIQSRAVTDGHVGLPKEPRPSGQKWIWMSFESPTHTPMFDSFEGAFNLTMSYRLDADIALPYGFVIPFEDKDRDARTRNSEPLHTPSSIQILRPRLAAWIVSHWSNNHARVAFYNQLRQYMEVDVFGYGHLPMPKDVIFRSDNVVRLLHSYLFYFAMENSQHTDYITEKLWNAIEAGTIPVVLGASRKNYERFLPPEAFIHVDDFPTAERLAKYLLKLRHDPDGLRYHLNWRKNYGFHKTVFWTEQYCVACDKVKKTLDQTSVVKNLAQWYRS